MRDGVLLPVDRCYSGLSWVGGTGKWLRGVDLNHRPLGYEPNELPDCSTPRIDHNNRIPQRQLMQSFAGSKPIGFSY